MDLTTPTMCLTSYMGYFARTFHFFPIVPPQRGESLEKLFSHRISQHVAWNSVNAGGGWAGLRPHFLCVTHWSIQGGGSFCYQGCTTFRVWDPRAI